MLLSGPKILSLVREGVLVLDPPPCDKAVGANSVDLRIGDKLRVYKAQLNFYDKYGDRGFEPSDLFRMSGDIDDDCVLDPYKVNETVDLEIPPPGLVLVPGILYLGHTIEKAGSNTRYAPMLTGRSSFARLGFQNEKGAGFGDVSFRAQWVLEIEVSSPFRVRPGDYVCQVSFSEVDGEERSYAVHGRYADQEGPVAARPLARLE